jgi:hypothetical protein
VSRVYPFTDDGIVRDRAGNVLAEVGCGTWKSSGAPSSTGQVYTHRGVVSKNGVEALVGKQNRLLVVGTTAFRVVDATFHEALGYVEVALIESKADG